MKRKWLFALVAAALPTLGMAGGYCDPCCNYDPCCCDPCYSQPCCDPCGMWDCCGSFEIFGEALYIQPSTCGFGFVIEDCDFFNRESNDYFQVAPVGKEHGICPDYEWGFRVGAGYVMDCGCSDIRVYYSRLCFRDTICVPCRLDCSCNDNGNGSHGCVLWPSYGPAPLQPEDYVLSCLNDVNSGSNGSGSNGGCGCTDCNGQDCDECSHNTFAKEHAKIEWNQVDLEFASRQMRGCNLWIRSHVGLAWTEICVNHNVRYQGWLQPIEPADVRKEKGKKVLENGSEFYCADIHAHNRTWGVGPRIGVDLSYDVFCGFGIGAHAGTGLFAGELRHNEHAKAQVEVWEDGSLQETQTFDGCFRVNHRSDCIVFPEFDAALGINYLWCCDCFSFFFEIGWEWRTYLNTVRQSFYQDDDAHGNHSVVCDHFAWQGLYIRGMITF